MDALNSHKTNLNYRGENNPLLRYGYYKRPNVARLVHMIQTEASLHKELYKILIERRLWVPGMKKQQALQVLSQKDYFGPENLSLVLDEKVKSLRGCLEFVPKYHPKLNFIDM